jgi:hypothetical protein
MIKYWYCLSKKILYILLKHDLFWCLNFFYSKFTIIDKSTNLLSSVGDPEPNADPRIRMFLGLPDPDPLVTGANPDPAPDPSLF